jgi:hypothetical protein
MTHIRNDRTGRQRRQAETMLTLAAAAGGLLAAAMAGSPTARADDPYTDIVNDVQNSITIGEADYSAAVTDFSTPGDTNEGLIAAFAGFDNTFISSTDYTLLGLTAAGTGTDFSSYGSSFVYNPDFSDVTAAGQEAVASTDASAGAAFFSDAAEFLSGGHYFDAMYDYLTGSYYDVLSSQADTLAGLFSLGI